MKNNNNARSYRENAGCQPNVNQKKYDLTKKENKRSTPAIRTCIRMK